MNIGAVCGLLAGAGLLLVLHGVPIWRRPSLADRLAPYLADTPPVSRLLARPGGMSTLPALEGLLRPVLAKLGSRLNALLGGAGSVRRRLDCAGRGLSVDQFRAEQVVWGAAGLAIGLSVSALLVTGRHAAALPLLVFCLASGVAGVVARDHWLTREVRAREARMLAELPTVAELIALAVAAGEGPVGALERVAIASTGELSAELTRVVSDAHAGAGFTHALSGLASRTSLPSLARFVDGMIVAIERGTPLADVLRAQAVDARDIGRRALLEAGGRKEIAMMVPIVFLVLPVTVLFAMFPGWAAFSFSAS